MYASFFGFRELPFNNTPDPRFFFSTPDHEEALASLIYAIGEGKGFVLLTGEVGSGKTLVTRLMLRHFGDSIDFASINNTQVTANELLQCVCAEFKIDMAPQMSNVELIRTLQDFLLASFAANKPVVLMLDEAQALSREAFEQVRMIGNLEADDAKLLQIVIVGQPELRSRFEVNDMRQLRQRIFRSFHLSALTREQTEGYIHHRLRVAGAHEPEQILDASAIDVVFEYSQGLPRLINTVCDNTMLSAYAADRHSLDGIFVEHVIAQMMTVAQGGPQFASPRIAPADTSHATSRYRTLPMPSAANDPFLQNEIEQTCRHSIQRLAAEANHLSDECARRLTQEVEHIQKECVRQLTREAGDVRDRLVDRDLKADAIQSRRKLNKTVERAGKVEANVHLLLEQVASAESRLTPDLDKLQQQAAGVQKLLDEAKAVTPEICEWIASAQATKASGEQAMARSQQQAAGIQKLLDEAKTVTSEIREWMASAQTTKASGEQAMAQLAEQSARTARLSVVLREVFDKLESRAESMAQKVRRAGSSVTPSSRAPQRNGRRILEKTRNMDRMIGDSKSAVDEMRSLIKAANDVRVRTGFTRDDLESPPSVGSSDNATRSPASQLANQVKALVTLIDDTRRAPLRGSAGTVGSSCGSRT